MFHVNDHFQKLPGSYLFAEIARRVKVYQQEHPEADIIRLGIGDVTKPLVPAVIEAMHKAVDEMGCQETFRGYGPDFGYDFLVNAIREHDYASRGVELAFDEARGYLTACPTNLGTAMRASVILISSTAAVSGAPPDQSIRKSLPDSSQAPTGVSKRM